MLIQIKNIGKVQEATIKIDGITVIAGENNTGKTTIGRMLFAIFNSFCDVDLSLRHARERSIFRSLWELDPVDSFDDSFRIEAADMAHEIMREYRSTDSDNETLIASLRNQLLKLRHTQGYNLDLNDLDSALKRVRDALDAPQRGLLLRLLSEELRGEFEGQINNIFSNETAVARLQIKDSAVKLQIEGNAVTSLSGMLKLNTQAIYLDEETISNLDAPIFFSKNSNRIQPIYSAFGAAQRNNESSNLVDAMLAEDRLNPILAKLNTVVHGDLSMESSEHNVGYKMVGSDAVLSIDNVSSGLKIFAILKLLLLNGKIRNKGLVILDEPEIHLHPEWQIIFAELLVMLQKAFDLHILLTTHSPYFLQALEVYSRVHGINNRCKYYQAEQSDTMAEMHDVSNHVERIYKTLAAPFQTLEDAAYGASC